MSSTTALLLVVALCAASAAAIGSTPSPDTPSTDSPFNTSSTSSTSSSTTTTTTTVRELRPTLTSIGGDLHLTAKNGEVYYATMSTDGAPVALTARLSAIDASIAAEASAAQIARDKQKVVIDASIAAEASAAQIARNKLQAAINADIERVKKTLGETAALASTNDILLGTLTGNFNKLAAGSNGRSIVNMISTAKTQLSDQATLDRSRIVTLETKVDNLMKSEISAINNLITRVNDLENVVYTQTVSDKVKMAPCTQVSGTYNVGSTVIKLRSCTGIVPGVFLLFHTFREGDGNTASSYDMVKVTKISGCTVTLEKALQSKYAQGYSQVQPAATYPRHTSVNVVDGGFVPYKAFDRDCGGLVAVAVDGDLTLTTGTINVIGMGYRGAERYNNGHDYTWGHIGEGWHDSKQSRRSSTGRGLGGGAGNGQGGGAGGAHYSTGGGGSRDGCSNGGGSTSGKTSRTNTKKYMSFGGGGGAAGSHGGCGRDGNCGGDGGGVVVLRSAGKLTLTNSFGIDVRGTAGCNGYHAGCSQPMGGGGGGAGGGVVLQYGKGSSINQNGVKVNGGNGGARLCWGNCRCGGYGGSGGVGAVASFAI